MIIQPSVDEEIQRLKKACQAILSEVPTRGDDHAEDGRYNYPEYVDKIRAIASAALKMGKSE